MRAIALGAIALLAACATGTATTTADVVAVPASTTSTPITTSPPSTTTTTSTLPRQLTRPIDAPTDVRAPENNPPIGRLTIPSIGLDAQLEEGIRLTTLDRGPGHWPGSALPGEIGNMVVGGHRTVEGAEFRRLDELVPGQQVVFTTDTGTFTYDVVGTEIVTPDAMWITDPSLTPTATLFACHPLGSTAQRIVVHLALAA